MLDFLGSQASVDMLELFCKNPDKEFYSKEIGNKLNLSKATTIKWLKNLTNNGILSEKTDGRKKFYKIRLGNPLVRQLRVLLTISELISAFEGVNDIKSVYLIGSAAKGTYAPDSSIELLILKRGDSKRIKKVLNDVSSKIGRDIEARILSPLEYGELARDNPKLHERLEREKIRLVFP